jgi:hypothetical protein
VTSQPPSPLDASPATLANLLAILKQPVTQPSHGFHLSLTGIALIGGAVFALIVFGSHTTPAFSAWLAGAKDEVRTHAAWLQRSHQLAQRAATARAAAKRLQDSVGRAQVAAESLAAQGKALAIAAQTVPQLREANRVLSSANTQCFDALTLCQRSRDSLAVADSLDKQRADENEARASRADSVAKAGVKARECSLVDVGPVHVGCPSRQAVAVGAFVMGVVVKSVVH